MEGSTVQADNLLDLVFLFC